MNLLEHQAKAVLAHDGMPVPEGWVVETPDMVRLAAAALGCPVVVKAQVAVGGRGKAGGVKVAQAPEEAESLALQMFGMGIKGLQVRQVLVEQALDIAQELYLGLTLNREQGCYTLIASAAGGMDIEDVARQSPDKIVQADVDPVVGWRDYYAYWLANGVGLRRELVPQFVQVAHMLYDISSKSDALLAEINPLAVTADDKLVAVDAKMIIDDNALYRQEQISGWSGYDLDETEREAKGADLSYIKLRGEIGCMVNGAGLAMAIMDMIQLYGGAPANFLDIGGGARGERVAAALRIIFSDAQVRAVLINIFGGITRCDEVATGIVEALKELPFSLPMIVRLVGTNEAEGRRILENAGMETASGLSEAVRRAVGAANAQGGARP